MLNDLKFASGLKTLTLFISLTMFAGSSLFAQWNLQGTVIGAGDYPSISVYSSTGVVVAGGPTGIPKVFKSTNSGANWTDISGNLSGTELGCVWAVNDNLIFAGDVGSPGGSGGNAKV